MSLVADSLLVYCQDNILYHFVVVPSMENGSDQSPPRLVQFGQISFRGIIHSPTRVRGISWILPDEHTSISWSYSLILIVRVRRSIGGCSSGNDSFLAWREIGSASTISSNGDSCYRSKVWYAHPLRQNRILFAPCWSRRWISNPNSEGIHMGLGRKNTKSKFDNDVLMILGMDIPTSFENPRGKCCCNSAWLLPFNNNSHLRHNRWDTFSNHKTEISCLQLVQNQDFGELSEYDDWRILDPTLYSSNTWSVTGIGRYRPGKRISFKLFPPRLLHTHPGALTTRYTGEWSR